MLKLKKKCDIISLHFASCSNAHKLETIELEYYLITLKVSKALFFSYASIV